MIDQRLVVIEPMILFSALVGPLQLIDPQEGRHRDLLQPTHYPWGRPGGLQHAFLPTVQ
jgi:hypothetical protein